MSKDAWNIAGIACLIVWLAASERYFYPSSAGLDIPPLLAFNASYVLLVIVCFTSYRRDSARAFTFPWVVGMAVAGVAAGSIAGTLVAHGSPHMAAVYACSIVSGFSSAVLTYAWADRLVRRTGFDSFRICASGILGASLIDLACMNAGEAVMAVSYVVLGVLIVAFLVMSGAQDGEHAGPIVYRPRQTCDYAKASIGIAVLSAALGIVVGSTADNCTVESMRALNESVGFGLLGVGIVGCIAFVVRGSELDWMMFLRLTPTALLVVTLFNIIAPEYSDIWNALTMVLWMVVRVLVVLLVMEVARSRIASLPLALPVALAVMMAGHCLGMLAATVGLEFFIDRMGLYGVVALVGLLAAGSSMLVLSNRLVLGMMVGSQVSLGIATIPGVADGRKVSEGAQVETEASIGVSGRADAVGSDAEAMRSAMDSCDAGSRDRGRAVEYLLPGGVADRDPFARACKDVSSFYKLSERESEVLALLARGNTRAHIAGRLVISENTVRAHVKSIYAKLSIHSKQQLIELVETRALRCSSRDA